MTRIICEECEWWDSNLDCEEEMSRCMFNPPIVLPVNANMYPPPTEWPLTHLTDFCSKAKKKEDHDLG